MNISYGKQSIDAKDIKEVLKSLKSDFLTQGPLVKKFEEKLSKNFKCKFATVLSNASAALYLSGNILNWKAGDVVAVSPITFISSVNSVEHCGAKPLFIDIDPNNYCMDPLKLERELVKDKKKKSKLLLLQILVGSQLNGKNFID